MHKRSCEHEKTRPSRACWPAWGLAALRSRRGRALPSRRGVGATPALADGLRLAVPSRQRLGDRAELGQGRQRLRPGQPGVQRCELAASRSAARLGGRAALRPQGRRRARLQGLGRWLSAEQRRLVSPHLRIAQERRCGRRIWLEFDGVFRDSTVFVNGWFVGHHESGYGSFRYDITDVANVGGKNVIAVRVDASQSEGWFYEGAGIYRHVWLVKTAPLAIAPDGVFVYSRLQGQCPGRSGRDSSADAARQRHGQTRRRDGDVDDRRSRRQDGRQGPPSAVKVGARASARRGADGASERARAVVAGDAQALQAGHHGLERAAQIMDRVADRDSASAPSPSIADKGFLLNGKPYVIKGTCNHQDHAGVGVGASGSPAVLSRREAEGDGQQRLSHRAQSARRPSCSRPAIAWACWSWTRTGWLGSDALHLRWLEEQVRRDRNHPSVAIWSIANEECTVQETPAGRQVAATMQDTDQAPRSDAARHLQRTRRQRVHGHQRGHRRARLELPHRQGHGRLSRRPSTPAQRRQRAGQHGLRRAASTATTSSAVT